MDFALTQSQTILGAMGVFFLGSFFRSHISFLRRFNIPEPIVGGLFFAVLVTVLFKKWGINVQIDTDIRNSLMLVFFATVGLNAKLSFLKKGGSKLIIFFLLTVLFLVVQNLVGVSLAKVFGMDPLLGLLAGSITLTGGHGTGASYAVKFGHIEGAMEIAMACATSGLILGGLLGGPICEWLITKYKLAQKKEMIDPDEFTKIHGFNEPEIVTATSLLKVFSYAFIAISLEKIIYVGLDLQNKDIILPEFILVMFICSLMTNIGDLFPRFKLQQQSIDLANLLCLSLFLSMAMMGLKLWELVGLALPLLVILFFQALVMILFSYFITFRALGKDYEAVAMTGGHCGFGLGAVSTAIAIIESVTNRYGPAPTSLFIVISVGAFFIDIANALVIQVFLTFL